ncbi:cell-cycle control medial ring component-domain-containing protein [Tuber brumale]|nr:cell-cycle control medial ring component-domain-containing protein [Tuber brumale]
MTELSFTKQFLSTLSSRPIRTSADYCEDARKLPARTPYTLPRTVKPKSKKVSPASSSTTTTSIPTANITLRSLRGASITLNLPTTPLSMSIISLKHQLSMVSKVPIERIKLLLKGRVLGDLKTLEEVGIKAGEEEVVVSIMVMGGGGGGVEEEEEEEGKGAVVVDEVFWGDLRKWLDGRVGGQLTEEMVTVFRRAWGAK